MPDKTSYEIVDGIAVITIDNPPVNAMSTAVRKDCWAALDKLAADSSAQAAVLICAGRTFIAGADITEFDKPIEDPWLPALVEKFEASDKLIVAAIHGTALGGGLETAMGCHYRCAVPAARVGLPEVNLGLIPGATGTQRLPRLAGVRKALDMMISGRPVSAADALEAGIVEKIIDGDLRSGAITYARALLDGGAPIKRVSQLEVAADGIDDEFFSEYAKGMARKTRGFFAPAQIVKSVEAAINESYEDAVKTERRLFDECKASTHSRSQRHLFFAEREVSKIPDVPRTTPVRDIKSVAVIGAGTMGGGITMNFVNAGIPVTVLEVDEAGLARGMGSIRKNYSVAVDKGRMTEAQLEQAMGMITPVTDYAGVAGADLVIEAVFENMDIKKDVFAKLDETCKQGAILASNTSSLDLDEIAAVTSRPQDVIGMHFFAPANIMKLLEIVRGRETAADVIATALAVAKKIRKTGVLVGVCFGFVGNRMFFPYIREAQLMMLEGIPPERVDQVAFDWGMAMGPHAVMDLSGLDVFYKLNNEWRDRPDDPVYCRMINVLSEMGRLGQKTGAGTYRYEGRKAVPDPEVMDIARREAQALGVQQIEVSDEEIVERLLFSMINEGARVLEEGIAIRPGDIDVIFVNGYGMPRYRGGPMKYADMTGLDKVYAAISKYRDRYGDLWWTPTPLLERLAGEGRTFQDWSENR
ncbi:MAG: 3-hydroxyacyl-CoA dehydrogenase NAD-binding domain-containing protein [Gammaproteobacteria bacterium]|nr:3-hydroxyacyl-CoA dehydrogenase NAD-binding domain-containing protein [Gammaproteobacteria bacterium]